MSGEAMAWAKRCSGAGSVAQLVLMLMADWADHEDKAWPGIKTLAGMTGRSERTIIRAIKRLEEEGLIEKSARSAWCSLDSPVCRAKGPHKHRTSNIYRLNVGQVARSQQQVPPVSGAANSDKVSLMEEIAESRGSSISDKTSPVGSISDKTGSPLVTPVSPVCNSDTPESYSPDQTRPDQSCTSPAEHGVDEGRLGSVRSGQIDEACVGGLAAGAAGPGAGAVAGAGGLGGRGVSAEDLVLVGRCLPESMVVMDPPGLALVVGLLRERLGAGWSPSQIRQAVSGRLPKPVERMSSLVASRLVSNVVPDLAPVMASEAGEDARREAARRRSEELAGPSSRPGPDPAFERALAAVALEMPGASRVELARAAGERLRSGGEGATGAA
nr:Uncharacterised protein [Actinomyces israelii]